MTHQEIIKSLLEQAEDKECFADADDPEDILSKDIEALREAVELLNRMEMPNEPLTLDQLRELDGKPVWLVGVSSMNGFQGNWDICDWLNAEEVLFSYCLESPDINLYGITWQAYRQKPEEVTR